jgi:hypothetical protein
LDVTKSGFIFVENFSTQGFKVSMFQGSMASVAVVPTLRKEREAWAPLVSLMLSIKKGGPPAVALGGEKQVPPFRFARGRNDKPVQARAVVPT